MARHKVLKSVAHNVAASFVSCENRCEEDYVPGVLLAASRNNGQTHYFIDMTSDVHSVIFDNYPLTRVAPYYRKMFWDNVSSQGAAAEFVHWARLEVTFDLAAGQDAAGASPFRCELKLIDDRGVDYSRAIDGSWTPEPFRAFEGPFTQLRLWWSRLFFRAT